MTLHEDWHKAHPGYPCEYHTCPQGQVLDVVTPDLPADKPKWADLFGIDPTYTGDATPDLPIPEEAVRDAAKAIKETPWKRTSYWVDEDDCPVEAGDPRAVRMDYSVSEDYEAEAHAALSATLPHLRSLQVETQVEYGRALGRKEAAEEIAVECDKRAAAAAALGDFGRNLTAIGRAYGYSVSAEIARNITLQPQNATSEPRTDLPVGPSHPKDSQTAREAL
jgi:hypothetical protein